MYIFGSKFSSPENNFPIKVEIVDYEYDPINPNRDLRNEGYQEMNLGDGKMTNCLSDIF